MARSVRPLLFTFLRTDFIFPKGKRLAGTRAEQRLCAGCSHCIASHCIALHFIFPAVPPPCTLPFVAAALGAARWQLPGSARSCAAAARGAAGRLPGLWLPSRCTSLPNAVPASPRAGAARCGWVCSPPSPFPSCTQRMGCNRFSPALFPSPPLRLPSPASRSQVVKSKLCGRRPTPTSRPRCAGRSRSLL